MGIHLMALGLKINSLKELSSTAMEIDMRVILAISTGKITDFTNIRINQSIKACGKITKKMVKVTFW